MAFSKGSRNGGTWKVPAITLGFCYLAALLGPISYLIIPILLWGLAITLLRKSWLAFLVLLMANPLALFFTGGALSYARGSPSLLSMGLPSRGFYNIDPATRSFRRTGGCVTRSQEWVYQAPHNAAVTLLCALMGPPSHAYDGPYPGELLALDLSSSAGQLDISEVAGGRIRLGEQEFIMPAENARTLLEDMGVFGGFTPGFMEDDLSPRIQGALYEDRCIILLFTHPAVYPSTTEPAAEKFIVLLDRHNMRPFAWYEIQGHLRLRSPRLRYLAENPP